MTAQSPSALAGIKPPVLAAELGVSVSTLRQIAREQGCCRVLGRAMWFTAEDAAEMRQYMTSNDGLIYFVQCAVYIKIGFTKHFTRRMSQLRRAVPFTFQVLHVERGTTDDEARYHERFKDQHHRHEWFYQSGELADFLVEVIQ